MEMKFLPSDADNLLPPCRGQCSTVKILKGVSAECSSTD